MLCIFILLVAATTSLVATNPLGTKTVVDSIIPTPLGSLSHSPTTFSTATTSMSSQIPTAGSTSAQFLDDPAAGNLAAAIAVPFGTPVTLATPVASSASKVASESLPPTINTIPLSITAISDTIISPPSTSSPSFSILTATVPLGNFLSTTARFAADLSAIVPITSYPSQSSTMPFPRLPEPPEESLSSLINNVSAPITISSSISTLYLPTGVPVGDMTTLPTSVPHAVPTTAPDIDPGALLKNVKVAVQVLEVLSTVLEGDSGNVSAVSIPEVGTSIGSNEELAELLRRMAVSLLS